MTTTRLSVLVFDGCPHADAALALAESVAAAFGSAVVVERVEVDTEDRAAALHFLGSPSLLVNGRDIEDRVTDAGALACRTYEGGAGVPPRWRVEVAVLRALEPRGLLFLCVANSARSQIAEGVARSLLPPSLEIFSAGSRPTRVRPEAVAVLGEIGVDASDQRAKPIVEIPLQRVDTVITLCGEEECPVLPGAATRLHWGLPDPAAVGGSWDERLGAFRATRDELQRRLEPLRGLRGRRDPST
jgi:arsenate reductase